jgi:hypothetical protein
MSDVTAAGTTDVASVPPMHSLGPASELNSGSSSTLLIQVALC